MTKIPKPKHCGQNWLEMTPTEGGRICGQCEKKIVDFSKKSWLEIEQHQKQNNYAVCGMYKRKQLDNWGKEIPKATNNIKQIITITSLTISLTTTAFSQKKNFESLIIKGKVVNTETNEPLPFANILLKRRKVGTSSDIDGNFQLTVRNIAISKVPDTLEITYVGYFSKKIIINDLKEFEQQENTIGLKEFKLDLEMKSEIVYTSAFFVSKPTLQEKLKYRFNKWFRRKK
jgi:hypothetical protein